MAPVVDEMDYNLLSQINEHSKNVVAISSKLNELSEGKEVEDKEEQQKENG